MVLDGTNVFLEDNLLCLSVARDFGEPSQMSRAPISFAAVANIMSEQKRLEAKLACLEVAHEAFTGATQITYCFVFYFWNEDGSEISGAHLASQVNSVLPVGLDTVSTFLRNKRRGNDNAFQAFAFQITIEAVTARTGFVGEYEFVAF